MEETIAGLIGVVLGWLLGFGTEMMKECSRRRRVKKALLGELKSNLHQLLQKKSIINQVMQHLSEGSLLSGESVHFASTIYVSHFPTISWTCSDQERASLHVIYEYLRIMDSSLAAYCNRIVDSFGDGSNEHVLKLERAKLADLPSIASRTESLIKKHLAGKPEDVLYLNRNYQDLQKSQFKL